MTLRENAPLCPLNEGVRPLNMAAEEEPNGIEIFRRLSPETAATLRKIITGIGLAAYCSVRSCKRARACSTRQVLCWQVNHEDLTPIIMRALALHWQRRVAAGEEVDVAPATVDDYRRILAAPEPSGAVPTSRATVPQSTGEEEP